MSDLSIRQFSIREADWSQDKNALSNLRRIVFIVEQKVPQEEEWDGLDEDAWHWIALDDHDRAIGTARLLPTGQIGRMAVLDEYRGQKVGAALLEQAVEKARHLGFDNIFLNAQTHALGFYGKAGFVPEGDEFDEAGIPHQRMTQTLVQNEAITPRKQFSGSELEASIREFDTSEVSWSSHRKLIRSLRRSALVTERSLPETILEDDDDDDSIHFAAKTEDGQLIGSARLSVTGVVSRLCVDSGFRHRGIGHSLLEAAYSRAQRFGLSRLSTEAPDELAPFYESAGYRVAEDSQDAVRHGYIDYLRDISQIEAPQKIRTEQSGDSYADDTIYKLGDENRFLLLRKEEEFHRVILEMCKQATQSIRILSPLLEHKLFDNPELKEIVSALARKNRYTSVEILLYDSHRVVKHGHGLLEICRKLPSSIAMKLVHPELRQLNHEYVLVDNEGIIYRQDYENFEGYANFRDVTENNRLGRQFRERWESGLYDANLRQLRI